MNIGRLGFIILISKPPGFAQETTMFARRLPSPLRDLIQPPEGQYASLDVLRTSAILMVIAGHTLTPMISAHMPGSLYSQLPFVRAGWTGVDLFFTLSGYLIGRQLWRELQRTNRIAIGRFMVRRGLRIWPLYFATLALMVLAIEPGRYGAADWLPDLLFVANYTGPQVVHGGWSLCIEEQFYLLAPLLLLLSISRLRTLEAYRPYLIGFLLLLPAIRACVWWNLIAADPRPGKLEIDMALYYPIHSHADGLVMGMLIANLEATGTLQRIRSFGRVWVVLATCCLAGMLFFVSSRLFNYTALALIFGSTICFCIARADRIPSLARLPLFFLLSRLSYGMYLNHQLLTWPLFDRVKQIPGLESKPALFGLVYFLVLATVSALVATITYCAIEFPFLRLRDRLLHRKPQQIPSEVPVTSHTGGTSPFAVAEDSSIAAKHADANEITVASP